MRARHGLHGTTISDAGQTALIAAIAVERRAYAGARTRPRIIALFSAGFSFGRQPRTRSRKPRDGSILLPIRFTGDTNAVRPEDLFDNAAFAEFFE